MSAFVSQDKIRINFTCTDTHKEEVFLFVVLLLKFNKYDECESETAVAKRNYCQQRKHY